MLCYNKRRIDICLFFFLSYLDVCRFVLMEEEDVLKNVRYGLVNLLSNSCSIAKRVRSILNLKPGAR